MTCLLGENIRPLTEQGSYTEPEGVPHSEHGFQLVRVVLAWVGVVPLIGRDSAMQKWHECRNEEMKGETGRQL